MGLAEIAAKVNWVDVLVLILLLKISYKGFCNGFSSEVMPLIDLTAILLISLHTYVLAGQFISYFIPLPKRYADLLSMLLIAAFMIIICRALERLSVKLIKLEVVSFFDRMGGACLGILRATLTISFVLVVLVLIPVRYVESSIKDRSLTGTIFLKAGPALYDKVISILPGMEQRKSVSMTRRFLMDHWI